MPRKRTYARISITLPREEVRAAADSHAKALDRPRSWIIARGRAAPSGAGRRVGPAGADHRLRSPEDFAAWKKARRLEGLGRS